MKFENMLLGLKVRSLIRSVNKRGVVTNWDTLKCDALYIYLYKDSMSIKGSSDDSVTIKL